MDEEGTSRLFYDISYKRIILLLFYYFLFSYFSFFIIMCVCMTRTYVLSYVCKNYVQYIFHLSE
jgi:hypothetical protein